MTKKTKETKEKKEAKEALTPVQIQVDNEKRFKLANERIGKICEELEVAIVPVLDGWPNIIKPVIKLVSTKKYEESENKSA